MNVDRIGRDRLANAMLRYLNEETTAFQFDGAIDEIWGATSDSTVAYVASALWYHYDDCKDHKVVLSKDEWDDFQRLVLLKSDAHVKTERRRLWSRAQVVAGLALIAFCLCVALLGFGYHLLAVALPFGAVSIAIAQWRRRTQCTNTGTTPIPFSSTREILAVRRNVAGFAKQRFPRDLKSRRIRPPFVDAALMLQTYAIWLMFSPVVLLFQLLPETETTSRVEMP